MTRIKDAFYVGLRDTVLARIKSGELTEDMGLSSVLDSLDTVQLTMEIEELGIEPIPGSFRLGGCREG